MKQNFSIQAYYSLAGLEMCGIFTHNLSSLETLSRIYKFAPRHEDNLLMSALPQRAPQRAAEHWETYPFQAVS